MRLPGLHARGRHVGGLETGPAGAVTKQLIETVEELARRGVGFRCPTQDIGTTTAGGRPPGLKACDLKEARALLRDPEITVEEVAARLKVSPSTRCRHLPGGRGAVVGPTTGLS